MAEPDHGKDICILGKTAHLKEMWEVHGYEVRVIKENDVYAFVSEPRPYKDICALVRLFNDRTSPDSEKHFNWIGRTRPKVIAIVEPANNSDSYTRLTTCFFRDI